MIEDVDRIEVIRGPGGTIWGANAVDGVINIITKSSKETHGLLLTAGGGNLDQGEVGFRYGGITGRGVNYRVYGKGFTRGPEYHWDRRNFDDWRMDQGGFRADWSNGTRDTLTLQGDLYNGDAGTKVGLTNYSPPSNVSVEQNAELSGGNLLGRWRRVISGSSDVELQAYYDRTNRSQANFAEGRSTLDIDFIHHLVVSHRHDFIWGLGARWSSGNASVVVPTVSFIPNQLTDKLYSVFVQDEISILGDQVSLTVGSKLLHNIYSGFEVQPSARLLWTPRPKYAVWLGVTRAVSTPSRVDEDVQLTSFAIAKPLTFIRLTGDRKFFSEQLVGFEAGSRTLVTPKLFLDVAAFYNDYNHLESIEPGAPFLETSPSPSHVVIPLLFRNGILGSTNGIEIAPEWTPTKWWRLTGSYSFLHMDLRKEANSASLGSAASTEGSSPHHEVVIRSLINLPAGFEFDQTYRYVSALSARLINGYGTVDLVLDRHFSHHVEISIEGQNLLQPHHAEFGGDPGGLVGIRRSAFAKITWQK
jgi:iron complex outermembrane receptor protein